MEKINKRVLESFDHNLFQQVGDHLYFQYTHYLCQLEKKIEGFIENQIYKVKTRIPIYRLFQPSLPHEDTYLHATPCYFVPFEDGYKTMSWKGYHRSHLDDCTDPNDLYREYYSFLQNDTPMDCLIEHTYQQNYRLTYYDKVKCEEVSDEYQIFYTSNVNVGDTTVIDNVYMEYIIRILGEKNPKREYVKISTEERMESYLKNMEDYQLMNEFLGEYGWNPKRRYLFKVAEMDYETVILIK